VEHIRVFSADTKELNVDYYVPTQRYLAQTNAWSPTVEAFPPIIADYSRRGIQYLKERRQFRGNLSLGSFDAASIMYSFDSQGNRGIGTQVERWVLNFTFSSDQPNPDATSETFRVVMLLDGTIAEQRLIRGTIGLAVPPGSAPPSKQ